MSEAVRRCDAQKWLFIESRVARTLNQLSPRSSGKRQRLVDADLIHAIRIEREGERLCVVNIHTPTALCFVINRTGSLSDQSVEFRCLGAINRHNRHSEGGGDMSGPLSLENDRGMRVRGVLPTEERSTSHLLHRPAMPVCSMTLCTYPRSAAVPINANAVLGLSSCLTTPANDSARQRHSGNAGPVFTWRTISRAPLRRNIDPTNSRSSSFIRGPDAASKKREDEGLFCKRRGDMCIFRRRLRCRSEAVSASAPAIQNRSGAARHSMPISASSTEKNSKSRTQSYFILPDASQDTPGAGGHRDDIVRANRVDIVDLRKSRRAGLALERQHVDGSRGKGSSQDRKRGVMRIMLPIPKNLITRIFRIRSSRRCP